MIEIKNFRFKVTYQVCLLILLIATLLFFGISEGGTLFKPNVLFGQTENIGEIGLMAFPMTFIIITGGIDLSVGSTMALSAVCLGAIYEATGNLALAIICGLMIGIICGCFNGWIIATTPVSPMVTTLATYSLYFGIARIIAGTNIYSSFPKEFRFLGSERLFGIVPYQFLLLIAIFIVFLIIYKRTPVGRSLRAIGFNEDAAVFSGINTKRIKFILYALSGCIAGVASLVYLSRLSAAKADIGQNLNLETITAVVLGGTSVIGGVGNVTGTFLAVLTLGVFRKGLQLVGLGGDTYSIILGFVLVICLIALSLISNKKTQSKE